MASPAVETKVERVTEAFENLALAIIHTHPGGVPLTGDAAIRAVKTVTDARKECADALRELLAPALRVVTSDGQRVA